MPLGPGLLDELRRILGPDGLVASAEGRLVYECDMHTFYKGAPDVVALPESTAEVVAIVRLCRGERVPIVPRGSGTGLIGGAMAPLGGVMIGLNRMTRIVEIDLANRAATVQPGLINLWLTRAVQERGWFFAPDPSSQMVSSIGGNVSTNAGGPHCLKYGITANHVLGLELVTGAGEVVRLGGKVADRAGYDLTGLAVGSEGTFGLVTSVTVRLLHVAEAVKTILASFRSIEEASETVSAIIATGIIPAALEMLDELMIRAINEGTGAGYPKDAGAVLLIELDGPRAEVETQAQRVVAICRERAKAANEALLHACIAMGGTVTGEHGVGLDKAKNLPLQYGEADLNFMARLRRVFDPDRIMNPGKLLPSHPACGEGFRPARPRVPEGTWI